ncbi:MAG TPA: hypothetical protein VEH84_09005 [Alphaproteobacteria bacterium]|nr:hypothetical protein [Alphaproteobacteria bacterium]
MTGPAAATATAALGGAGISALQYATGRLRCENVPLSELPSPDGQLKAVVFRRTCRGEGATTEVSVVPPDGEAPAEGAGNVFTARYDAGDALAPAVQPQWAGTRQLAIGYDRRARMVKAEPEFGGVELSYAGMDDAATMTGAGG